ncbi:MAG: AmmeMemoRadiSam system protein B [Gammaproteobacteria bacterium]
MSVRQAAVAGTFYPADPSPLRREVAELLASNGPDTQGPAPKALIVPHAGYMYSGEVAARAYRLLEPIRDQIQRVVLLGPAHRVWIEGMAVPSTSAFYTPLGRVALDRDAIDRIAGMDAVLISDAAHAKEHSLEVQLPFLQTVLDDFLLVPIAVGHCQAAPIAAVIDTLWGGSETLIVISSDLSHFLDYQHAIEVDSSTRDKILARCSTLTDQEACGARAINGLMRAASARDLAIELVDLRNSGDTAGDQRQVVGYGSFVLRRSRSART